MGHQAAAINDSDPMSQLIRLLKVVSGEENGQPLVPGKPGDALPHGGPHLWVESDGGFVQQQHRRPVDERHRDVEPALHAARVGVDEPSRHIAQFKGLQKFVDTLLEAASFQPVKSPLKSQVLPSRSRADRSSGAGSRTRSPGAPPGIGESIKSGDPHDARVGPR